MHTTKTLCNPLHNMYCAVELSNLDTTGRSGHFDRTGGQIRPPHPIDPPSPWTRHPSWVDCTPQPPLSGHHNRNICYKARFPQLDFGIVLFWIWGGGSLNSVFMKRLILLVKVHIQERVAKLPKLTT